MVALQLSSDDEDGSRDSSSHGDIGAAMYLLAPRLNRDDGSGGRGSNSQGDVVAATYLVALRLSSGKGTVVTVAAVTAISVLRRTCSPSN